MRTKVQMEDSRQHMLDAGWDYFSKEPIESVTMPEIAKAAGVARATLYRYYNSKAALAIAIANWKMADLFNEIVIRYPDDMIRNRTAAERFGFYLDAFIDLYRDHKDLLRFIQFLNIYIRGQDDAPEQIDAYLKVYTEVAARFHNNVYLLAQNDGTVRTDIPEEEMFTVMTHLMLAAATRYAMGTVYHPEQSLSPEDELILLKQMILRQYCK